MNIEYNLIKNDIKIFKDIARKSKGVPKLSLVYIDTNNLLDISEEKPLDMLEVTSISNRINVFFTMHINSLLKDKFPNVYCISSSSSDILLICPFSETTELVIDIYNKFDKYIGSDIKIPLLTSIVGFNSKHNIKVELDKCIFNMNNIKNNNNLIYFMGEKFTIDDFITIFKDNYNVIIKEINNNNIDMNTIKKMQIHSKKYSEFLESKDIMKLIFEPLFSRNIKNNYNEDNISDDFKKYIEALNKDITNYNKKNKYLYYARYIMKYILHTEREGEKNE